MPTIAIIGAGNMGAALISGLAVQTDSSNALRVADPDQAKLEALAKQFPTITTTPSNADAITNADVILIAVKPQHFAATAAQLKAALPTPPPLILSIAAGIPTTTIAHLLGAHLAIVRCMPNTPALIGAGITGLFATPNTNFDQKELADTLLTAVGTTVWVEDEANLDAITALSGSGPAYLFLMMEAMQAAGEAMGLSADLAKTLTEQTFYGSSLLAIESEQPIAALRHSVTSPGGTTEAALNILQAGNFSTLILSALKAAQARAHKIGSDFNQKESST